MSDSSIWRADPHTVAKHIILESYLEAWTPIMTRQGAKVRSPARVLFIDGFAGPGVYIGGQEGSPIRAIRAALDHTHVFPAPVDFLFIEIEPERHAELTRQLEKYRHQIAASPNVRLLPPVQGECANVISELIDQRVEALGRFGPALVFLDQFGYSDVPLALIAKIMAHKQCEVFSYLNYKGLNRFLPDKRKDEARTAAFGTEEWRQAVPMQPRERGLFLLDLYKKGLQEKANAEFVWSFAMADVNDVPLYWLFFCTNNLRGLKQMKRAMWSVDETGGFRFSDRMGLDQLALLSSFGEPWLMDHLAGRFEGKTLSVGEIEKYVLTETPCYSFSNALQKMRRAGRMEVPGRLKQRIPLGDDPTVMVRFCPPPPVGTKQGELF